MRRNSVNKALIPVFATLLALGFSLNALGFEISINVSPNVLNIESQGEVVTVHTDIAYGLVDATTVDLNGVIGMHRSRSYVVA